MNVKIRKGVFETNSSSTHAISVSGNALNDIPESLHFGCGEFGWEKNTHRSVGVKAAYLWTYIFNHFSNYTHPKKEDGTEDYDVYLYTFEDKFYEWKEKLTKVCKEVGVKNVTFQETAHKVGWTTDSGYIDHSYELGDFVEDLWKDEYLLKQYLFCRDSGIETGNDNDDEDVTFEASNEIYDYYKGN